MKDEGGRMKWIRGRLPRLHLLSFIFYPSSLARRWIFLLLPVVALGVVLADWWFCLPEGQTAHYVGRAACAKCHAKQTALWTGSDHDLAMDPATPKTVLGDFNGRHFTHGGITSTMACRDGRYSVTTDGPTGKLETFAVKYVLGVWPLQQYLVEFPDGRIQCLPIAWDGPRKQWFHLYPNEAIPHDDPLHWTRSLQNWNYMCAECHTTNLKKNYDAKTNRYHTQWSEIDVSCETCHGPGSLHVQLATSHHPFWDRRYGRGLFRLKGPDSRPEIETCAPCHSRRRIVYPDDRDGQPVTDWPKFLDHYVPELLDGELYHADGQILDEDYEYGSFLQAKMYAKGVRCSDCHDPHSLRVKYAETPIADVPPVANRAGENPAAAARSLRRGITDNRLCSQCHVPTQYDTAAHHHHPDDSKPGTLCVECHMPVTKYMVVDPRRDHSLRVPRPDLTVALGIPNACNGCHHDKAKGQTPQWAAEQVQRWYGKHPGPPHFAHAIAAGRQGKPEGQRMLEALTRRKDLSPMVRASAAALLGRYDNPDAQAAAAAMLDDPEPLVRVAAIRGLEGLPADGLVYHLPPLLDDPLRAVRTGAARLLSRVPRDRLSSERARQFDRALAEYLAGQQSLDDQPAAHLNLAVVRTNLGQPAEAEAEYLAALRIDPRFVPARINLAMLFDQLGKKDEAVRQFRQVIDLEPKMAEAHYSLGLLLAEDERRLPEAAERLAAAARLAPENARIHYNYGLALQKLGRAADAEQELTAACKLARSPDHLHALAVFYIQQKRWPEARKCAEELIQTSPNNAEFRSLPRYIDQQERAAGGK